MKKKIATDGTGSANVNQYKALVRRKVVKYVEPASIAKYREDRNKVLQERFGVVYEC